MSFSKEIITRHCALRNFVSYNRKIINVVFIVSDAETTDEEKVHVCL